MQKAQENSYNQSFFDEIAQGSLSSAEVVVPYLMEWFKPASVLDVGCAEGAWLSVFGRQGVTDHLGVDGDYVDRNRLLINASNFIPIDLEKGFSLDRKFDLALCLEVAEHLSQAASSRLVSDLVSHASCIVFSASAPFQDGTGHINEQWIDYWVRLFNEHGYAPFDCIRHRVWNDKRVRWWFAQNTLIYIDRECVDITKRLYEIEKTAKNNPLPMVHPELLMHKQRRLQDMSKREDELRQLQNNTKSTKWLLRQVAKKMLFRNK